MLSLKHKNLLFILAVLMAVSASVFGVVRRQTVLANHDQCFGLSTLGSDTTQCTNDKRDATNRACFTVHEGDNPAIAECVNQSTAHYAAPPDSAPALPRELSSSLGSGSNKNVTEIADCKVAPDEELNSGNCRIVYWINIFINVLSVLVGIVVTIMIIFGGIQYTAAREDPNAVAKAKKQIFNAVFALVAYGLMYALLQYLIPGGLL